MRVFNSRDAEINKIYNTNVSWRVPISKMLIDHNYLFVWIKNVDHFNSEKMFNTRNNLSAIQDGVISIINQHIHTKHKFYGVEWDYVANPGRETMDELCLVYSYKSRVLTDWVEDEIVQLKSQCGMEINNVKN